MPVFKNESNGTWYVMARYVNWKGERKQKCKRGFATKKEAQEWERMFQLQNSSDMDMSFEAFTELYIRDMKSRLKENTWLTKEHIIRTKILPYFGKLKISEISTKEVIAWQNEMLAYRDEKKKPYSQTYLKTLHNQLSAIFNHAVRYYELRSNPAATPLWNYTTRKGTVLYLALEDDYRRLQERLYRMFGTESTDNLYFSVSASQLGNGLDEQLARFVAEHKDTKLIIIDTLQKVREVGGDNYSYANDYQIMARLKSFADAHGLCLLLVHHTRKQNADDKFDMISGTSGLLGAADGAFLLQKEKRTGNAATLEVSGRDQQDQKLYLIRNTETLLWDLQKAETELWKEPPEPLLDEIAELVMKDNPYWEGSPTALVALINVDIQPHVITRKLNVLAGRLYAEHGILFRSERVHEGRKLRLWKDNTENA